MSNQQPPKKKQNPESSVVTLEGALPTIYGPVPSRRHGNSLGINLGNIEHKVCTWGCLYCQCGMGERRNPETSKDHLPSKEQVVAELKAKLPSCGKLDSVTFAGNTEPTSHPQFLEIVREVRKVKYAMRGTWVLNCLSNGSELDKDHVVDACGMLDEAWIKLDCATDDLFRRLNRPVSGVGSVADHVKRIKRLKKIWIQTLLWTCPGDARLGNWTEENLSGLLELYRELRPVDIHVTTVSRDPAYEGLEPVSEEELERFAARAREAGLSVKVFA